MYKSISTDELKGLIGRINIIDIRDSYLFNNGNIPTSKNVPVNFLLFSPDNYMKKDTVYYISEKHRAWKKCCFSVERQAASVMEEALRRACLITMRCIASYL